MSFLIAAAFLGGSTAASSLQTTCTALQNTDFDGHDLQPTTPRQANGSAGCCDLCVATPNCSVWTYMGEPSTLGKICWLKTDAAGVRTMNHYTSGCNPGVSCPSAPTPTPPAPTPPPTPVVRGGGACKNAMDCSLGGECTASKCVCDAQYTGVHCAVLRLRRAKLRNDLGVNISAPNPTHHWGGHAIQDVKTKKWVGFFSYMAEYCDLNRWQSQSMIISAVSDAPDGPFNQERKPVLGPWSHNAMISKHPNGTYFLFHVGEGTPVTGHPSVSCAASGVIDPVFPFPSGHPIPAAGTTHAAESLQGPWRLAPGVPKMNNPAVYFWTNGTTAIYDRDKVTWAPSIDGPWLHTRTYISTVKTPTGTMKPEDPFVWKDAKNRFHMLINANSGHYNCKASIPCGGHLWSEDGLEWSLPYIPAFGTIVHMEDGTNVTYDYSERPQIAQMSNGTPLTFYFGHGYKLVENVALMFCQDGDKDEDCVTTVQ